MTVLEDRFMNAAIAYFNRVKKENKFIELTKVFTPSGNTQKIIINKDNLIGVSSVPDGVGIPAKCAMHFADMSSFYVAESYDEIKAML